MILYPYYWSSPLSPGWVRSVVQRKTGASVGGWDTYGIQEQAPTSTRSRRRKPATDSSERERNWSKTLLNHQFANKEMNGVMKKGNNPSSYATLTGYRSRTRGWT